MLPFQSLIIINPCSSKYCQDGNQHFVWNFLIKQCFKQFHNIWLLVDVFTNEKQGIILKQFCLPYLGWGLKMNNFNILKLRLGASIGRFVGWSVSPWTTNLEHFHGTLEADFWHAACFWPNWQKCWEKDPVHKISLY